MLTRLCNELKNWFIKSDEDKCYDTFTIKDGTITPSIDLKENQYYRIVGSTFNDGVHQFGEDTELVDEEFDGAIWKMYVPMAVLNLAEEIETYISDNDTNSPYSSESFGGYSYSKITDSNGAPISWQLMFHSKMNPWRKIR